ncbi:hypothetical protein HHK36_009712 [Tetracentron sinense]|uniref:CSC1/OSCA1-like N-terminal transmembrane domain-containing protein n=1 Tax=Tetracentron sinense TaxID=13715 RepID=A0A835DHR6_TETSI|nr:hypothetical protein HHK36_009712 [Tetracentron sinense]
MKISALLTSAGINIGLCVLLLSLYSILRKQPGNFSVYFGRRLAHEHLKHKDSFCFDRLVPSPSWIVKAWQTSDEEILVIAGLDAVVFLRILVFSIRIFSIAAVICILLVLPLNYHGQEMHHKHIPSESLDVFTIGNVKEGSKWWLVYQHGNGRGQSTVERFQHQKQTIDVLSKEEIEILPRVHQPRANREVNHDRDLHVKVDIPEFTGEEQPEEVLNWLNEFERVFEYLELPDNKKVKLVAIKLRGYALSWDEEFPSPKRGFGLIALHYMSYLVQLAFFCTLPLPYERFLFIVWLFVALGVQEYLWNELYRVQIGIMRSLTYAHTYALEQSYQLMQLKSYTYEHTYAFE